MLNYGATIQSNRVPTPDGLLETVLGYDNPASYLQDENYLGSTVGRYANRIADARLNLEARVIALQATPGAGGHCLHGGEHGFSGRFWNAEPSKNGQSISFHLQSEHGDQGFPGHVKATVTYSVLDEYKLMFDYRVTTDRTTVINLANHAYFNLNPDQAPIDNHRLQINADRFTPVNERLIPTGELSEVKGSCFDYGEPKVVGKCVDYEDPQINICGGYDHNFVLNRNQGESALAATLWSPQSEVALKLFTTQTGLQLYTGQHLTRPFRAHAGLCLEAQRPPNAPNILGFPSAVLHPGMLYQHFTMYEFSLERAI